MRMNGTGGWPDEAPGFCSEDESGSVMEREKDKESTEIIIGDNIGYTTE